MGRSVLFCAHDLRVCRERNKTVAAKLGLGKGEDTEQGFRAGFGGIFGEFWGLEFGAFWLPGCGFREYGFWVMERGTFCIVLKAEAGAPGAQDGGGWKVEARRNAGAWNGRCALCIGKRRWGEKILQGMGGGRESKGSVRALAGFFGCSGGWNSELLGCRDAPARDRSF